jgi:iron complex outermembrane receptor protein/vitamin B12 transporter
VFELVQGTPAAANILPVGPEKSRGWDIALEQGFGGGQYRARIGYYDNEFESLLEFLDKTALVRAGVPPAVANATAFGGYINSQSFTARGVELSADAVIRRVVRFGASYTYLDAEVTEAFGASAATNPAFPGVQIGAFSPLVGERPFRRPANSGTLFVSYANGPAAVALSAYFAGKRDDSTFLSDGFFGNSLLLPNQDLDPAYQKVDLSVSYRVHRRPRCIRASRTCSTRNTRRRSGSPRCPLRFVRG